MPADTECRICLKFVPFASMDGEMRCKNCVADDWISYLENKMIKAAEEGDHSLAERCAYWIKRYQCS